MGCFELLRVGGFPRIFLDAFELRFLKFSFQAISLIFQMVGG